LMWASAENATSRFKLKKKQTIREEALGV